MAMSLEEGLTEGRLRNPPAKRQRTETGLNCGSAWSVERGGGTEDGGRTGGGGGEGGEEERQGEDVAERKRGDLGAENGGIVAFRR